MANFTVILEQEKVGGYNGYWTMFGDTRNNKEGGITWGVESEYDRCYYARAQVHA